MRAPDVDVDAVRSLPQSPLWFARRRFLGGLLGGGVLAATARSPPVSATVADVSVGFDDCQTAVVTGVRAADTLSVYYRRQPGTRLVQHGIPATETELYAYRPLLVRYDANRHRTTVRLAARGSLVRVLVADATGGRTGRTNDVNGCVPVGFNAPPEAAVSATTADSAARDGETLVVETDETITFSSTATDRDLPAERLRYEWDLDGDGRFEAAGVQVTTTRAEAGTVGVGHRVTDDFDTTSVATLTVDARRPWRLRRKLAPAALEAGDQFGTGVAVSGDLLVASGPGDDDSGANAGAAYVYDLTGLDRPPTKLAPVRLHDGDLAGIAVAATDASVLVSAVCDDEVGTDAGAVYVYDRADLSRHPTKLAPASLRPHDFLGLSLAALDGTLVAGAHLADEQAEYGGSLFVFDLTDASRPATRLAPDGLEARDLFGISVAVTDEWVVGGAVGDDDRGAQTGAVYLFDRADLTRTPAKLVPDGLAPGDQFGRPLAAQGDTLVVGTAFDDERGEQAGAAYVYDLSDRSRPPTRLVPAELAAGDLFGYSAALSAETLVVGAIGDDTAGTDAGAVYVYDRSDLSRPPTKVVPDELVAGDLFGFDVAAVADTLAVSAVFDDERGEDAGAVYLFER